MSKEKRLKILLAFVYSAYEKAQNKFREHEQEAYMKYFPVIQGSKLTITLSKLADKYKNKWNEIGNIKELLEND